MSEVDTAPQCSSTRTLLVADPYAAAQFLHSLSFADEPVTLLGCILPELIHQPFEQRLPVLGTIRELSVILENVDADQVLVSLPVGMKKAFKQTADALDKAGIPWRWLPTFADQLAGLVPQPKWLARQSAIQPALNPVALLDRRPRPLDEDAIASIIADRVVMITGAGGSIGSELARIVCRFKPERIELLERSENALFEIDRQIASIWPNVNRRARLHDVTDGQATMSMVMRAQPDLILHAAAHKHVPVMEDHPSAAIENNLFGTRSIADAADAAEVDRFVMISTDKAVNPTSIMGASKRLAERYVQSLNQASQTLYRIVRFGNVLGSACSVLPIWTSQLQQGGPITVTDPAMTRYFMTIPEAAGLVLQAAALQTGPGTTGKTETTRNNVDTRSPMSRERWDDRNSWRAGGSEIFLLDMGEPVNILDMAKRFIRAHRLEPEVDIDIRITGARPGEKLHEELVYGDEDCLPTTHDAIRVLRCVAPQHEEVARFLATFDNLRQGATGYAWEHASDELVINALRQAVPEMQQALKVRAAG